MSYWGERQARIQEKLTKQSYNKIKKQLIKYYQSAAKQVIGDFERVYDKILLQRTEGKPVTPAHLYQLDTYWQAQAQLRKQLTLLGEKEVALLTREFETNFFDIYYSIAPEGMKAFNTIDTSAVNQLIDSVWLADGKTFSKRVWENTESLVETLNDELIHITATGKPTRELKNALQQRFNVSYSRANTLVRTELAHIQTVAAAKRYEDYGLTKYRILGNDNDTCGNHSVDCHKMDGQTFLYSEMEIGVNAPPFHPNCKCCIVPIVE